MRTYKVRYANEQTFVVQVQAEDEDEAVDQADEVITFGVRDPPLEGESGLIFVDVEEVKADA